VNRIAAPVGFAQRVFRAVVGDNPGPLPDPNATPQRAHVCRLLALASFRDNAEFRSLSVRSGHELAGKTRGIGREWTLIGSQAAYEMSARRHLGAP
jgi:hypothetical protein